MKVLFVTQQILLEEKVLKGGEVVSRNNYEVLKNICGNENVQIISIPEEKKTYRKYMQYMMFRNMYSKHEEREIVRQINGIQWDVLFFDGSWFGRICKMIIKKGKIVTFLHNVEHQYSLQRLKKNPLTISKFLSVSYNEKCLMKKTDYIITLNTRDDELVEKYYQKRSDLILPIVLEDKYIADNSIKNKTYSDFVLLFVGSYFNPNKEGVIWFIENVMPYVNCKLMVAGKGMEKLKRYENDKVVILGTVDNLGELYQEADAVVIPIFSGGGMKVKTAEAMMYGKRILATKEALTGYNILGINAVVECNTKEDFIIIIKKILNENSKFYPEIRQKFLTEYEYTTKEKKMREFFLKICKTEN